MIRRAKRALAIVATAAVAACATEVPQQTLPKLTYGHLSPLVLNVGAVEVASEYAAPMAEPHVDHLVPTPPENALRQWATDRLKAGGGPGIARFVIKDARVIETALARDQGVKGAFTKEPSERYDATIEAVVEIVDADGKTRGHAAARATRSRSVLEDVSLNERDRIRFELIEALMTDFDAEIERNIRTYLGNTLR